MILAAVSPVFERMFYGDFKEGKSKEVGLPKDSYKTVQQLIDIIYKGSCEINDLDDSVPLMEMFNRFQINKVPLQHVWGEAVLSQLDSCNYLTLLPKYVSVMSEESHKKAANKVMSYTNNDFVTTFDETKDLPEEVMLQVLKCFGITCYDIDIFEFLIKWHNYQTKDLGKSLQLTPQVFQCVRYSLIIPQLLYSKVATSDLTDKQLLNEAYCYLYNSSSPLGVYGDNDCRHPPEQSSRKPFVSTKIHWVNNKSVSFSSNEADNYDVSFNPCSVPGHDFVIKSMPLGNGIYSFYLCNLSFTRTSNAATNLDHCNQISFNIAGRNQQFLHINAVIYTSLLITIYIHDDNLFIKFIEGGTVISTTTTTGTRPFSIYICNLIQPPSSSSYSFSSRFSIRHLN